MTPTASGREAVRAAFEAGDELAIRRLGWFGVWEACATWWAPRQTCTAREMVVYVKLLGDEDPAKVLEALRDLAGDWRPHPAAVRGHLHRKPDESAGNRGSRRDRFLNAEAVEAVADALTAGEQLCACSGSHPSRFRHDQASVLRCRDCAGLEPGQVYAAEDAAPIEEAA